MKKLLSILLVLSMMISLCAAFSTVSFAEDETEETEETTSLFEADEYDATDFSFSVKDQNGLNVGQFLSSSDADAIAWLYNNGYAEHDDLGVTYTVKKVNDNYTIETGTGGVATYFVYSPKNHNLLSKELKNREFGGYYNSGKSMSLAMNKFPIDIDVHLSDEGTTVSGVRVYPRADGTYSGNIKTYEVWVKFPGEGWTYLYTDGNKKENNKDYNPTITTSFGYNATVTDVRIRVTETFSSVGVDGYGAAKGTPAYFTISAVTVLKPYGEDSNGIIYTVKEPKTVTSADEIDEIMNLTATVERTRDADTVKVKGMDNDLSTTSNANGKRAFDFGKTVRFSGIRIYPPKDGQDSNLYGYYVHQNFASSKKALEEGTKYTDTDYIAKFGFSNINFMVKSGIDSGKVTYPTDSEGNIDKTKPVTIMFKSDIEARSIYIEGWGTDGETLGKEGVGEIRLIKPRYETDPYLEGTIPWDGNQKLTSEPTRTKLSILTDGIVCDTTDGDGDELHVDFNDCLKDGATVKIQFDLGEAKTFSGLRVVGRQQHWNQALAKAKLYVSDDNTNWVEAAVHEDSGEAGKSQAGALFCIYKSTKNIYTDVKTRLSGKAYNVTARYIKLEVLSDVKNADHFAAIEMALIKPNTALETLDVEGFKYAVVDERVPGSLENKNTLEQAETLYNSDSKIAQFRANYDDATVKEVKATFGTPTVVSDSTHKSKAISDASLLVDGIVSDDDECGNTTRKTFTRGDYTVFPSENQYITITLPVTEHEEFTGIRFYARKQDNYIKHILQNCAEKITVKLTDKGGSTYVTTGVLTMVKGTIGATEEADDIRYVDFKLKFGGEAVKVKNIGTIEIKVLKNVENKEHWGSEEVRLINDSTVTGNAKTVAEIAEASVTSKEIVADTGVLDDKGIIRFITEFEKIADGTEIEYFGTYVIKDGAYDETKVKKDSDNVGVYYVSDANVGRQPKVGDTFSVDVKGIGSGYYETGVTAVSFVKIAGYDNLILTGITSGIEVNKDRTVELPKAETTTETTGTEE